MPRYIILVPCCFRVVHGHFGRLPLSDLWLLPFLQMLLLKDELESGLGKVALLSLCSG